MDAIKNVSAGNLGTGKNVDDKQTKKLSRRWVVISILVTGIVAALVIALPIYYSLLGDSTPYEDGHDCEVNEDCVSTRCVLGVCTHIANGQSCTNDIMCYSDSCLSGTCHAIINGGTCKYNQGCYSQTCQGKVCQGLAYNAPCTNNQACTSLVCSTSNLCDRADVGGPCIVNGDCYCGICDGATHLCIGKTPGATCSSERYCCDTCVEGTCRTLFGASCTKNTECPNFHCNGLHCNSKFPGEACNSTQECYDTNTCMGGSCHGFDVGHSCYTSYQCNSGVCSEAFGQCV